MKGFMLRRPLSPELRERLEVRFGPEGERIGKGLQCALPAISLGFHTPLLTAFSNSLALCGDRVRAFRRIIGLLINRPNSQVAIVLSKIKRVMASVELI